MQRFNLFSFALSLFLSFLSVYELGISIPSIGLEIFRLSILIAYYFNNGYAILLYLDYPMVFIQQAILFYFVTNAKNYNTIFNGFYIMTVLCMIVILPKFIFDYLIVSNVMQYSSFFCGNFQIFTQLPKISIRSSVQ